jgi:hypothetical protein
MRFSWKNADGAHRAEVEDKVYQITKSPAGAVWELYEIVQPGEVGLPRGMSFRYLTNAKSLVLAKKIASDLHGGKIYLDEECVPRKVIDKTDV